MVRHMGILFLGQFHSRCAVRKAEYARSIRTLVCAAGKVHVPSSCVVSCMQSDRA